MPYLIFIANGEEYDRRDLRGPMLLGRAPDCDLAIPDITLSRHHCRVEPSENGRGWQLVDLHSKNGSQFRGQNIQCHVFRDGDELRIGRTRVTFRAGKFVKSSSSASARAVLRAVDPHEALSGTVSGMVVCEPGETERHQGMPIPQPRATAPAPSAGAPAPESAAERTPRAAPTPKVTHAASPHEEPAPPRHAHPAPPHGEQRVSFDLQADHAEPAPRPSADLLEPDHPRRPSPMLIGVASAAGLAAVLFLAVWASVSFSSHGAEAPAPPAAVPASDVQSRVDAGDDLAIGPNVVSPNAIVPSAVAASAADRSAAVPVAVGRHATAERQVRSQPLIIRPETSGLRNRSAAPSAIDLDFVSAPAHPAHPVDIVPDDLLSPIGPSHVHRPPSAP